MVCGARNLQAREEVGPIQHLTGGLNMRVARFKVAGQFTGGGYSTATVVIDRTEAPLFGVRPSRSRRVYEVPLAKVAEYVVWHITKKELADKRAAKKKARRK